MEHKKKSKVGDDSRINFNEKKSVRVCLVARIIAQKKEDQMVVIMVVAV